MPSISASKFTRSECSVTWKHDPQDKWFKDHSGFFATVEVRTSASAILEAIAREAGSNVAELAKLSGYSVGTARKALVALVDGGLAAASRVGRSSVYFSTPLGVAAIASRSLVKLKNVMPRGMRILKAIGYDATEEARLDPNAKGSTFRAGDGDDPEAEDYGYWYPLMEWGWDRSRCYAEIERELAPTWEAMVQAGQIDPAMLPGPVPGKSSCFFCGAMKPEEIRYLTKEDLHRAILMELVFLRGRSAGPKQPKGLAVAWSWADFAAGKITPGMPERAKRQIREFGRLLTETEIEFVSDLADEWIRSAPRGKGAFDASDLGRRMGLLAFTKLRGLRGDPGQLGWDLYEEQRSRNPRLPHDPLLEGSR
jgi:DNA-binding transcriptional ArsR family regulator